MPTIRHYVTTISHLRLQCKLALAAETGVLRGHIVTQNLSFVAFKAS
jgi:hypothetical protein